MSQAEDNRSSGIYLGRILGIRFYLDYSWFLIAALVIYTLSARFFPTLVPGRDMLEYLLMGSVAAVLFFASILLHEMGHSVVSQRCGIPVPRITLLFIGGIAEIAREPEDPKSEFKIAAAGPAVSLVLVVLYEITSRITHLFDLTATSLLFSWLASVNLALVIFNAIPGYPLDGGRILRSLLWAYSGNLKRATYITSRIGVAFSWMLMFLGILAFFGREWSGVLLFVVGLFLKGAAESGYMQTVYNDVLEGIRIRDLMSRPAVCVPAATPTSEIVDRYFLPLHHEAFPVCDPEMGFKGILRLDDIKSLPRDQWPSTSAEMLASDNGASRLCVDAEEAASLTMRRLLTSGHGHLAVLEGNRVVGVVTRHDLLQFIRIHTELGFPPNLTAHPA